jgi:hypothetical protein
MRAHQRARERERALESIMGSELDRERAAADLLEAHRRGKENEKLGGDGWGPVGQEAGAPRNQMKKKQQSKKRS